MKEKYTLKKNIKISITIFILGAILGRIFCEISKYDFKNIIFVVGLILLSLSIFSNLSGGNINISGNTLGELNAEYLGSKTLKLSRLNSIEEKGIEFSEEFIENIFSSYILVPPSIMFILIGIV